MKVIISNNIICATHKDVDAIDNLYGSAEIRALPDNFMYANAVKEEVDGETINRYKIAIGDSADLLGQTPDAEWAMVRIKRNNLLTSSDIYVLPDRWESMAIADKQHWAVYRQTLRDIPQSTENPADVVWPTMPVV